MWWVSFREPCAWSGIDRGAVLISIWICGNRELTELSAANGFAALPNDVLIVEDDPIIALDCEDTILGFGVKTVRTAGNVARALDMIADRAPDFALLDVGLIHENSFAVAERLDALRIPFVFVTGYGPHFRLPAAFADRPTLRKPYSTEALQAALQRLPGAGRPGDSRHG